MVRRFFHASNPADRQGLTGERLHDRRGVLEWGFEAKPVEVKDISFAWRVRTRASS